MWEVLGDHSNVPCHGEGRAVWDKLHLSADAPGSALASVLPMNFQD